MMTIRNVRKALLCFILVFLIGPGTTEEALGQVVVDRTMAVVADGVRSELITLSDLKWQLALQSRKVIEPPSNADLDEALRLVIDQRIFALEAERLPRNAPTPAEVQEELAKILSFFPSTAEFERRLRLVGFTSIRDENFERLISKRLAIEKYIQFRFRSFIVVTRDEEELYFNTIFIPEFRRQNPGSVVPSFEASRELINQRISEEKVFGNIESFLDQAKLRIDVTIFNGN